MMQSSDRPVFIYDGECAFCRKQIANIQWGGPAAEFEFIPCQTPGFRLPVVDVPGEFH